MCLRHPQGNYSLCTDLHVASQTGKTAKSVKLNFTFILLFFANVIYRECEYLGVLTAENQRNESNVMRTCRFKYVRLHVHVHVHEAHACQKLFFSAVTHTSHGY